jgi:hypothetical protein
MKTLEQLFDIVISATVEIISAEYHQNPMKLDQNIWRLKVLNGPTTANILIHFKRDASTTKELRNKFVPGAIFSFKGTMDRDSIVAREFDVKGPKEQLRLSLSDIDQRIERMKSA